MEPSTGSEERLLNVRSGIFFDSSLFNAVIFFIKRTKVITEIHGRLRASDRVSWELLSIL